MLLYDFPKKNPVVPWRIEAVVVRPRRPAEQLHHLPGQDPPELVPPQHVDGEVGGGVDGEEDVGGGDDLLDRDGRLADVLLKGKKMLKNMV